MYDFQEKGTHTSKDFSGAVDILSPLLSKLCQSLQLKIVHGKSFQKGDPIQQFFCTLYATDVIFQQGNRPSGLLLEGKLYFSGKHQLYS